MDESVEVGAKEKIERLLKEGDPKVAQEVKAEVLSELAGKDVTLDTLNKLGLELKSLKETKDYYKKRIDQLNAGIKTHEIQIIAYLEASNMDRYHVPEFGTLSIRRRLSYKVPKEPYERERFFTYLRAKGIYQDMVTVHSQTLNSWANKELEIAKAGGASDFEIPGLGEPTLYESLGVTKR